MSSRRDFLRTSAAGIGLLTIAPALIGADAEPVIVPSADTAHTAEKLRLGEAKHYVFWTGKMRDFRLYRRWAHYYTAEEFSFTFDSDAHGTWQVISREPTPWHDWRMGTTFLRQSADELARGTRVRVMGLKNFIDRLPKTFQNVKLDVEHMLSALIVEVWRADAKLDGGGRWAPWHINNWFHNWGTPADDALIASHYIDKPAPYYLAFTHQSTKNIFCGGFTDKTAELVAKDKRLANTPGAGFRLVSDAKKSPPWALEVDTVVTPDNKVIFGELRGEPLPLSKRVHAALEGVGGWEMKYGSLNHRNVAEGALPPPLKLRWKFTPKDKPKPQDDGFPGSPTVSNGRVYCGNNDGHLYCIDARTGKQLWSFRASAEVESTPALANGRVVFGSFDGFSYCLDAVTGKEVWRFRTGPRLATVKGIAEVKQGIDSSAMILHGLVYFGAWDGGVYCLRLDDGKLVWKKQLEGIVHHCSPAVAESEGRVYIGSSDGLLHCFDAAKGDVIWEQRLCGAHIDHMLSDPVLHEGKVYCGAGFDPEKAVYCLEADTGKTVWKYTGVKNLVAAALTVEGGAAFGFVDGGGQVFRLDAKTGKEVWSTSFGKGWGGCAPLLCPDTGNRSVLYVAMREGSVDGKPATLVALDLNGKPLWSFNAGPVWGNLALVDGILYFGSDDGSLYAMESRE